MCVLIVKPSGVKLPNYNILRAASKMNRDGFGFISTSGRNLKTMDFEEFYQELKKTKIEEEVMIHLRWATHGSIGTKNCHPFYDEETGIWFAHNGILPIPSKNDMTDSEIAFRTVLIPAIKEHGFFTKEMLEVSNEIRGYSKFAFMKDGYVFMTGDFKELDGCYYSNFHFMSYLDYYDSWGEKHERKRLSKKEKKEARKYNIKHPHWINIGGVKVYETSMIQSA